MSDWRNPKYDVRAQARPVFAQALSLSLALVTFLFLTVVSVEITPQEGGGESEIIEIEQIPETNQLRRPPAPTRPQMPIPTMDEEVPEDVTIPDTDLSLDIPMPPAPPALGAGRNGTADNGNSHIHTAWEEAPMLVRMVMPDYPPDARSRRLEGFVELRIVVDASGDVTEAEVLRASPPGIFEDKAIEAIMKWKYRPAKLRNSAVSVRITQTVEFTLRGR